MSEGDDRPTPVEPRGDDRYTMAEAARLKGVSYHTVSRAVRSGRLPARRLGRMALIAAEDLHAWRPMRERAPRKYRRPVPDPSQPAQEPSLTAPVDANQYIDRLVVAMEQIVEVASAESISRFGGWVAQWLATSLRLPMAVLWRIDPAGGQVRLHGVHGIERSLLPERPGEAAERLLTQLSRADQVAPVGRATWRELGVAGWAPEARHAILVPLCAGGRCVAVALALGTQADAALNDTDHAFAARLGAYAAFALEHVELRRANRRRDLSTTTVLDELPLMLLATDLHGTVIFLNRPFVERWGEESRARYLGRHYTHFLRHFRRETLNGVEVPLDEHPLTRALRGEAVSEDRYLVPEAFGEPKVIALAASPIVGDRGEQTGAILSAREATTELESDGDALRSPVAMLADARRRVELLARLSTEIAGRRDTDDVFDIIASHGCAALDADYGIVLAPIDNGHMAVRAAHNMGDGVVGRTYRQMSVPMALMTMAERDLRYVGEDEVGPAGREMLDHGGGRAALFVPLIDGDQALGVLVLHYRDVDRLRQVDPELARAVGRQCGHAIHMRNVVIELEASRSRLLTTLDQLPQAVVILDGPDGIVSALNREAQALWGDAEERIGEPATEIELRDDEGSVIPPDRHPFTRPLRSHRTELGVPVTSRTVDGELVDLVVNVAPVTDGAGELRGAVAVLQRREHFRPIDQAKDEFISVVAHELRNPLTSLRGNLQLLERRLGRMEGDRVQREIERVAGVIEQVDRIGELVSRMLDVSRADLGKLTIDPVDADAARITRAAVADVSGQLDGRRVTISGPETLPVQWDQVRVQQILVNLLTNAARYAPEGDIEVTLAQEGERVAIAVRDHGPGVPPKLRRRLFRLYYRFDDGEETADALATQQRGLGIGLYISARLARAHGGELTVSDAPGGGAVFTLRLPVRAAPSDGGR